LAAGAVLAMARPATAGDPCHYHHSPRPISTTAGIYQAYGAGASWNTAYYKPGWNMPLALVVPPTAETQSDYGWGVGNYRVTPIYPQFQRQPTASVYDRRLFRPTPVWPSDTKQFGVNYVRGPW
jgi:hypothetical protein